MSTLLFSVLLVLSVSFGCDEQSGLVATEPVTTSEAISVQADALVVTEKDGSDEKIAKAKEYGKDGDAPSPIFNLWWFGEEAENTQVSSEVLTLQLYNFQKDAALTHVTVTFNGLLTEPVSLDLGEYLVDGEQEMLIDIPATEIPLQTTDHVCSAYASASLVYESNNQTWQARASGEMIYYQHKEGYEKLKFFKQKVFKEKFGGVFIDHSKMGAKYNDPHSFVDKSLGRKKVKKKDANGVTETVVEDVVINRPPEGGAVLVGIAIGSGPIDEAELEKAMDPADDDTTDKFEVADELL